MDTEKEIEALKMQLSELKSLLSAVISADGTVRATQIATLPKDTSVTVASGSVRIETSNGPVNVLIV